MTFGTITGIGKGRARTNCRVHSDWLHAGARSAVYGTMLAVVGVGLAGTLIARSLDIRSAADLQERMQTMWAPVGNHAQQHVVPWRLWLQVKVLLCVP